MAIQAPTLETDLDPLAKKQQDQFVKPVPKIEPQRAVSNNETMQPPVQSQELVAPDLGQYEALGAQTQSLFNKANQDVVKTEQQLKDLEIASENKKLADQELSSINEMVKEQSQIPMERGGFFDGMSTTQKIVSGIGLFLASLTPEGAKSAVRIIEGKIDSDLKNQIMKYNQKGDQIKEKKTIYANYMDRFKDEKTALLATKASILEKLKVNLAAQEAKASSIQMKERAKAAYNEAVIAQEKVKSDLYAKILENKKKESSGVIPGYIGTITDPTAARDFRKQLVETKSANNDLDSLIKINESGFYDRNISTDVAAQADAAQKRLVGSLRVALTGPGAMNESEQKLLQEAIANPTKWLSLQSSNRIRLKTLKQALNNKLRANAEAYGLTPENQENRKYE